MTHPNFAEAVKPSYMDSLPAASVVSATMGDTNLVIKNRAGATVADLLIKDPDSAYVEQIVQLNSYDLGLRNVVINDWTNLFYHVDLGITLSGPPVAALNALAWSPDGIYLAVGVRSAPFVEVYKRAGDVLTKLAMMPTAGSAVFALAWSGDGRYLYTGQATAPVLMTYKRTGDTFAALPSPTVMPPGYVTSLSISYSAYQDILSVGIGVAPYIHSYAQIGDTLTILAPPEFTPQQQVDDLAWSPTGKYLTAVTLDPAEPLFMYRRISDLALDKIPAVSGIGPTGTGNAVAWSPNERYVAFAGGPPGFGDPTFYIYKRSGDTFAKISDPTSSPTFPPGNVLDVSWSPDSRYLAVACDQIPAVTIYQIISDVPVLMPYPKTLPVDFGPIAWSPNGKHLIFATGATSPFIRGYKSMQGPISGAAIPMRIGDN